MRTSLFLDRKSFIHRMHPVSKMLSMLILFAWALTFNNPLWLIPILIFIFCCALISRSLLNFYRMKTFMLILFCVSFILWSLIYKGTNILIRFGFITISSESLLYGLGMGIRLNILFMTGLLFVSTTRVEDFTSGLNLLGIPYRISFTISLAFRLVPVFISSGEKVIDSQKIRGLDLEKGSVLKRIVRYVPVIIPVFMNAIRRAKDLSIALESKGFGYSNERVEYRIFHVKKKDVIIPVVLILVFFCLLFARICGFGIICV